MTIEPQQLAAAVNFAVTRAFDYVKDNINGAGLANAKEYFAPFVAANRNPYDTPKARECFRAAILKGFENPGEAKGEGKSIIIYRAGALGAAKRLVELIGEPSGMAKSNFANHKAAFANQPIGVAGEILHGNGQAYDFIRGACSGCDQAIIDTALKLGHNLFVDNTLAPKDEATWKAATANLESYKSRSAGLSVTGLALTPDAAAALNPPEQEMEARATATAFRKFFDVITSLARSTNIFNDDRSIIFHDDPRTAWCIDNEIAQWSKACGYEPQVKLGGRGGHGRGGSKVEKAAG